jgi:hypothetical protein
MAASQSSSTYSVERSTFVNTAPEDVYARVVDFHNWVEWSPWEDTDPALQRTYTGEREGTGAVYAWKGNRKAGQGRMEMTDTTEPERVTIAVAFEKPFRSQSTSVFTFVPEGDGTKVTWSMSGASTMMTRVMGIFTSMDKLIGPDFEKGLARLRAAAEQRAR